MHNKDNSYDLVVLGAGPGGYVAAIRAAQLGMNVMVVERDEIGGICLNWGCIPTKSLLRSAEVYHLLQRGKEFGLEVLNFKVDFPGVIDRSRRAANRLVKGVQYLLHKNKIEVIKGTGRITKRKSVEVYNEKGEVFRTITAGNIIIATGARPKSIPGVKIDGEKVISSKEAMLLQSIPSSMMIIGAGAIGVEFAYFYDAFGTKVALIEMMPQILPLEDQEISDMLRKSLTKSNIEIHTEARVKTIDLKENKVIARVVKDNGEQTFESDVALMAIGVQGNIEEIGLEQVGVETEKNFIKVKKTYQTNVPGIYAVGDVIGPPLLAHIAFAEGAAAAGNIAGVKPRPVDYKNSPNTVFCTPQVASVGMTEKQAKEAGYELKIGRFPFRANGKALTYGNTEGIVKLIFDAKHETLLGAHMIGPQTAELIGELGVALSLKASFHDIHHTIHSHPTLSETIMEAAAYADGVAIHI